MLQKLIAWARELRLLPLLFIILPVTLGSAIALKYDGGGLSRLYFGISIVAILLLQGGTITYNYLFDYVSDSIFIDKVRAFLNGRTGLMAEFLRPLGVFSAGSACLGLCALIGLYIAVTRSLLLLPVGAVCVGMGVLNNFPFIKRPYPSLGDAALFVSIPLIALCAFIVQVPIPSLDSLFQHARTFWMILAASLPLAFMGICGILTFEFSDRNAGKAAGKIAGVYPIIVLSLLSYIVLFADIILGMIPLSGIPVLITVPLMAFAVRGMAKYKGESNGIAMPIVYVVASCIVTGLLLILAYL